jgi:hypothetical protein
MTNQATTGLNLLISDKPDIEREALADAFALSGGVVHRLGRFWDPPALEPATVRVYGADSFCLVLQQKLGFALCSPSDDLLLQMPPQVLHRRIVQRTLADALTSLPAFVKPLTPKQFRGAVYGSPEELAAECRGLPPETAVIVAEPVALTAEVRSFVLDGQMLDAAIYEGNAALADASVFISELVRTSLLPRTVVVDVGYITGRGWAVIEFNAAWGAGLNGCDAVKALPAILAASGSPANCS